MLTEHEEKLIQRYYIYPKIAITAVIMALALGVPFILLEMIDDLVFHDEEVIFWGLYVYLGFAALYLILFCYCTLRAKLGMRKEEWQELQRRLKVRQQQSDYSAAAAGAMAMGAAGRLMQKSQNKTVRGAGTAAQVAGAVGAVATAGAMSAEIAHNAQAMAEAYGVPLPRTKGLRTVLVLLPLVILIGTYIPQYSHAHTAMQQNTLLVSQRIEEITKALDPVCEYISADDPAERYQDYGYRVIGYLRGMNTDSPKCYVYISLDSTGVLESLSPTMRKLLCHSAWRKTSAVSKRTLKHFTASCKKQTFPPKAPNCSPPISFPKNSGRPSLPAPIIRASIVPKMVKAPVFTGALKPNPRKNLMNTPIPAYTSMCGHKSLGGRSVKYPLGWRLKLRDTQ